MKSIKNLIENYSSVNMGDAYLIGCGTGDVELLTIKAYKKIQELDIALVDHLISDEIKEIIPSKTKIIDVGKKKGFHKKSQLEINELMFEYVRKGFKVGRLKSGDPYIFGRGAEEVLFLRERGVKNIEVIAGISSAISAPLTAGIAPTIRNVSDSFSVVTAHLAGNRVNLNWIDLLKIKKHTVIVLMGLSKIKEIIDKAFEVGIDKNYPVLIISNASRENQKNIVSNLKNLKYDAKGVESPAILVFGECVNFVDKLPKYIKQENVQLELFGLFN